MCGRGGSSKLERSTCGRWSCAQLLLLHHISSAVQSSATQQSPQLDGANNRRWASGKE